MNFNLKIEFWLSLESMIDFQDYCFKINKTISKDIKFCCLAYKKSLAELVLQGF